jgi:serine/threonine protein phosphatase PrpC
MAALDDVMAAPPVLDWAFAGQTLPGETESGDLHLVKTFATGVLLAVVDGLGHGADAASAARAAVAVLDRYADESIVALVERCHRALVGTRGAVMSLARIDHAAGTMTWLGIGNVEGILLYGEPNRRPARDCLVTRGGTVGRDIPPLRTNVVSVSPGDTLLFASDGIKGGFADSAIGGAAPQQIADQVLANYAKGTDDALILVARYLGENGGTR